MYSTQTTPTIKFQGQFGTCLCSARVRVYIYGIGSYRLPPTFIQTFQLPWVHCYVNCYVNAQAMNLQFKKDFIKLGLPYTQHWLESKFDLIGCHGYTARDRPNYTVWPNSAMNCMSQ